MTQEETRRLNLIKPSSEQARRNGRKGGLMRAANERKLRPFKTMAQDLSDAERQAIFDTVVEAAMQGSLPHFEMILKLLGEHPTQEPQNKTEPIEILIRGDDSFTD